jgi:general secretion pathway protein B
MSFILDALKKSETDRQRQGGPALFEVKVAPQRSALPPWALAIAVLFVANLALVGWLLLRHTPAAASAAPPVAVAAATPATATASAPLAPATTLTPGVAPGSGAAPSAPAAQSAAAPSLTRGTAPGPALDASEDLPGAAGQATSPDDYAPAAEAPPPGNPGRVKRGTDSGVPLYQQLATSPNSQLPQLRLDLHAYAERADDRWVMINMHKLHEGESLEGVRVERITPEGAVLSWQGSQFLLTQE